MHISDCVMKSADLLRQIETLIEELDKSRSEMERKTHDFWEYTVVYRRARRLRGMMHAARRLYKRLDEEETRWMEGK